jgi:hypothetical protein
VDLEETASLVEDDAAALAILAAALTHVVSLTRSNPGTMTQAAIHRTSNPSTPVRRSFS